MIDNFRTEFRIPDINGERCVHAKIEQASCKACIIACPNDAWLLSDDSLSLNASACDGCGLCVPVCSEQAISQTRIFTLREQGKNRVLLLGCENAGLNEANIACIHAVSYHELLKLYRKGIYHILVTTGDCTQCRRGDCDHLSSRIANLNKILEMSHLIPFIYKSCSEIDWIKLQHRPEKAIPGHSVSRRNLFGSLFNQVIDILSHQFVTDNSEPSTPLGMLLPPVEQADKITYPAVPNIDHQKCNGCDLCIQVCPHDALSLYQDETHFGYAINAATCTSCNLCIDMCEPKAVSILNWSTRKTKYLPLISKVCHSCGINFHYPREGKNEHKRSLCNICLKSNHSKKLFQVIPP